VRSVPVVGKHGLGRWGTAANWAVSLSIQFCVLFLPHSTAPSSELRAGYRWHEAGDVGVEAAAPAAIVAALRAARPAFPPDRREFTVAELQQLGLVNTFDAKQVRAFRSGGRGTAGTHSRLA
jgi:hypothetical protein